MAESTQQRRERVVDEIHALKHVAPRDLALRLGVSEATIRRDLHALAGAGEITLTYGSAAPTRRSDYSFRSKARRNVEAKRVVARLAAALIPEGAQIFLDSGTTTFEMLPYLRRTLGVSVITNSARVALELDAPGIAVIMLGGQYRPDRMDTIGPLAEAALGDLRGYTAFIGADGLTMEAGLSAADIESAHLFRLAAANAQSTVLVVDHSKFDAPSLCRIVDWSAVARVVTDRAPTDAWSEFLVERGIAVTAPVPEAIQGQDACAGDGNGARRVRDTVDIDSHADPDTDAGNSVRRKPPLGALQEKMKMRIET